MRSSSRRLLPLLIVAVLSAACSAGDAPYRATMQYTQTMPRYEDVPALVSVSDVIVLGRVSGEHSREVDEGSGAGGPGTPMVFYDFTVEETLDGQAPASIVVAWLDSTGIANAEVSELDNSGQLVLFLEQLTAEDTPGLDSVSDVYVPVAGDNSVMDVGRGYATGRSEWPAALGNIPEDAPRKPDELRVPFEKLKAAIDVVKSPAKG